MKYTVVWSEKSEGELVRLWMQSDNRREITAAANEIDAMLARDPMNVGESRDDQVRILIRMPLVIHYEVDEPNRLVRVVGVWQPRRKLR